jgi:hypothetical protein
VEGKVKYCIEVSNRFAALEYLETGVDINSAWETIKETLKFQPKTV